MRKLITAAVAAATLVGSAAGVAAPAEAAPYGWHGGGWHGGGWRGGGWRGGHYYHGGGIGPGAAAAIGLGGLAIGAALASPGYRYGYSYPAYGYGYPAYGYAYPAYGYGYAPAYCQGGRWQWDPYLQRNVWISQAYPC